MTSKQFNKLIRTHNAIKTLLTSVEDLHLTDGQHAALKQISITIRNQITQATKQNPVIL